jgi:hybrid cluster-associated redox disulfide protein
MTIFKDTKISDIVKNYPLSKKFFSDRKMGCYSCLASDFETVEKSALLHGLEVNKLVHELNAFVNFTAYKYSPN